MKATNIKWETDNQKIDLPTEVDLPLGVVDTTCCEDWKNCENNSESVNNYLSDEYGWLVEDYNIVDDQTEEQHFCPDGNDGKGHTVCGNDNVYLTKDNTTYCLDHYHELHEGKE